MSLSSCTVLRYNNIHFLVFLVFLFDDVDIGVDPIILSYSDPVKKSSPYLVDFFVGLASNRCRLCVEGLYTKYLSFDPIFGSS